MAEVQEFAPGTFSWVDLGTTDVEGATKFYGQLFGWESVDFPAGEAGVYRMFQKGGKDVAALYELGPQQREQGIPPHWMSYVTVAEAETAAGKAKELGGTVVVEPMDVMEHGRMSVIQDPTGALVTVWEPKQHKGAALVNEPGTLCWNELATTDRDKAGEFYSSLFDWNTHQQDMGGDMVYTTFHVGERPNGGMMQMTEQWNNAPSHWMPYFAVADCDETVEAAKGLGAEVMMPPNDIPGTGRFSVLRDPQGAYFSIIALAPMNGNNG